QSGGQALLNDSGKVEVITLSTCLNRDCPDIPRPTKNNIRAVFDAFAKKARPEDVFMLYLSGHGKVYEDYFYYLTQDMGSDYLGDNAIRQQYAISSAEFAEWLNAIPARKQVMMIDACASGQFNKDLALLAMKNIPSSQIRALDRLRDRTGIYIISGSANDQASYEASPYGMGLLTYSLLSGMSGGALREDEYMDVEQLFQ
ncbi:MAG: caspase family protein, partial [Lewinella sp.]|nr:caspase family protein [Lewinella sp.]